LDYHLHVMSTQEYKAAYDPNGMAASAPIESDDTGVVNMMKGFMNLMQNAIKAAGEDPEAKKERERKARTAKIMQTLGVAEGKVWRGFIGRYETELKAVYNEDVGLMMLYKVPEGTQNKNWQPFTDVNMYPDTDTIKVYSQNAPYGGTLTLRVNGMFLNGTTHTGTSFTLN